MPHPSPCRIATIDSLTGFGLFKCFAWDADALDPFDRYNLVYGWNYSGKTTLSRAFQCLEDASLHPDFAGGSFCFTITDGTTVSSTFTNSPPYVRVFNRHFIQKNFHANSDMTGAPVIVVIGEANQALKNRLANLERRLARVDQFRTELLERKLTLQQKIADGGTIQARIINEIVGGPYDRRHLKSTVDSLPLDVWPLPFDADSLNKKKEQFRKASDFSEIGLFLPDHRKAAGALAGIRKALIEVATYTALAALEGQPTLANWVQEGLRLNAPTVPCKFCGGIVSQSRWDELRGHFSAAFAELQQRLRYYRDVLASATLAPPDLPQSSIFPDLRSRFRGVQDELRASLATAEQEHLQVDGLLQSKLTSMESIIEWQPNFDAAKRLRGSIRAYNAVLSEHNAMVAEADLAKENARRDICAHFAVEYLRDFDVLASQSLIESLEDRASACSSTSRRIRSKATAAQEEIQASSIAVQKINDNLAILLPNDNIEVVKINDTDFQFQRDGVIARNMSEGERTVVAFSYFLAKLDEDAVPIGDAIVVIDDPVSSLDSNHIYAVHSITENRLARARQLFVFTHNSSFFGLTKYWMKGKNGRFYMTQRSLAEDGRSHSSLVCLPPLLKKFNSDYQYTYYCLKLIDANPLPDLEHLCGVPNMIRRLLEAYLGFMFPESGSWTQKLPRIVSCDATCGKIKKFADEHSHFHSMAQVIEIPDYIAHCKEVIHEVLAAMTAYSPQHVASLEAEIADGSQRLP